MRIKNCSGPCKQALPISDFGSDRSRKDGLCGYCRECQKEHARKYRTSEHGRKAIRKYRRSERGREIRLKGCTKYREGHREEARQYAKKYYGDNRGKEIQRKKEYRATINGCLVDVFNGMTRRCNSSNHVRYSRYGGRGIQNKFTSIDDFRDYVINVLKIDPRGLQVHRIDNDESYQKGNITFLTSGEHAATHAKLKHPV